MKQKAISAKERLPENGQLCLVYGMWAENKDPDWYVRRAETMRLNEREVCGGWPNILFAQWWIPLDEPEIPSIEAG